MKKLIFLYVLIVFLCTNAYTQLLLEHEFFYTAGDCGRETEVRFTFTNHFAEVQILVVYSTASNPRPDDYIPY